jgi:hypothetical protein
VEAGALTRPSVEHYGFLDAAEAGRVHTSGVDIPTFSDSIVIARQPHVLYDLVSDVTRMSEWSPVCKECWWEEDGGPHVGAWFVGRNEFPDRSGDTRSQWESRSEVTVANRGREFAYVVAGSWMRFSYSFASALGGTRVTETWRFLPRGLVSFHERFGDDADVQIAKRAEAAHQGIQGTLAAIKQLAEAE